MESISFHNQEVVRHTLSQMAEACQMIMEWNKGTTRYLNALVDTGLVDKVKIGRTHYYINVLLTELFLRESDSETSEVAPSIESVSEIE